MRLRMTHRLAACLACISALVGASTASGMDPAQAPVAVRWWGQAYVTIETWWGLTIAIDPYDTQRTGYADPERSADLVLITHSHGDHNNPDLVNGSPFILRGLNDDGVAESIDVTLDRRPNDAAPRLVQTDEARRLGPHPVRIQSVPSWHDDAEGSERGANALFLIEVDGVRILHCGDLGQKTLTPEQLQAIGVIDALLIPVGGRYTIDGSTAAAITMQINPRYVVPIHYKTPDGKIQLADASSFLESFETSITRRGAVGNTLAVAARTPETAPGVTVVQLGYEPWRMPRSMAEGLANIAESREAIAKLIESMSKSQFDHKPSNGTHTVRWNAEHTAGAEMIFASLVFKDRDPEFPIIRISPAQQPADYSPSHPDWTPAEEAAHIRRVGAFLERFAYLLEGVDPSEERYPAYFKSLSGLYDLVAKHYTSHHHSVEEKFELQDWPRD